MLHPDLHYPLPLLLVGLLLLLLGRRLFWLFVAVTGFMLGFAATPYILPHQSELFTLLVALALGIAGALLAIFLQKVAVAICGFLAGGFFAAGLCSPLIGGAAATYPGEWLSFLIGAILGAILMIAFFNWVLIVFSSLQGADWVVTSLPLHRFHLPILSRHVTILILVLALIGIIVQASTYRRRPAAATGR
jgi:hypothetical protein